MKKHIDLPVFADNDATVAAVYEYHFGALKSNVGVCSRRMVSAASSSTGLSAVLAGGNGCC